MRFGTRDPNTQAQCC